VNDPGKLVLQSLRGKNLVDVTLTDFYWMVAELARLYEQADQHDAIRRQREHFKQRASTIPPAIASTLLINREVHCGPHTALCSCDVCQEDNAGPLLTR
jgi:hypothetical protein